ncbi:putative helicase [Sphaerochaeta pleomorpha str. Grapes]|uniref:Putative helicase n=1 Tax=Sphaerochaeta pleomorpha (strain ATCC BAA-1885 / DSM 22778 / Grapes) TaxID=158190 RepID=G8QQN3_SPHPG|nr:CRISPR-associated helicase/endonuclease Cas3 [Sphaerochaeta pleomorpha]AEV30963.1 putative helicase [Sphaerochaeta pleomorpha str. Grapes]
MKARVDIAHCKKDENDHWDTPQNLIDHLENVARMASDFSAEFCSSSWGYEAGINHDTGKGTDEWQEYIRQQSGYESPDSDGKNSRLDHSSPSSKLVEQKIPGISGRILSYLISGHHTGLPDWEGSQSSLHFRLQQTKIDGIHAEYRKSDNLESRLTPPWQFPTTGLDISLWMRMVFSSLVDADFLDTESYMDSSASALRSSYLPFSVLISMFEQYMQNLVTQVSIKKDTPIYKVRQLVLKDCKNAAKKAPGMFSLTVPTGGGKTLASLAFALSHIEIYAKKRIIYVIPYTSIIEQTANIFKQIFGEDQVIEHHSNFDMSLSSQKVRLASENWDAPIIVTTSVQFLESLFASKPSRCRKLHNIANSVVIFDEVQLLPIEYLKPILESLELICSHYKTTTLFCTATQPAFEKQDDFPQFPGFAKGKVREIIQDVPFLYKALRRVELQSVDINTIRSFESIAFELTTYERVLCIVSDRKSCRELHALMPVGTYHLSALMCPEHRSDIIAEIKEKLKGNGPVRVISTQLIEAGVDIDFPVVYRSIAGFDSIAQAAGRCNREGVLEKGKLVVFVSPRRPPVGILRKATDASISLLNEGFYDFLDPSLYRNYFSRLYWLANSFDAKGIVDLLEISDPKNLGIQFRTASEQCKIIDDSNMVSIFVPYCKGSKLLEELTSGGPYEKDNKNYRAIFRKLQRYSVSIYKNEYTKLLRRGSLVEVFPEVYALNSMVEYDFQKGLLVDETCQNPETFMV